MTIAVCGFPRCGSTMTMAMLEAGGIEPAPGSKPGSYEVDAEDLYDMERLALAGRAVKLLDFVLWTEPEKWPTTDWRFIWLDRGHEEQAKSMVKFFGTIAPGTIKPGSEPTLRRSFVDDRPKAFARLKKLGPILPLRYEQILSNPLVAADRIRVFSRKPHFNVGAAAAIVHDRDATCRPDLAIEMAAINRGAA